MSATGELLGKEILCFLFHSEVLFKIMRVKLEFSGGMDMLFGHKKLHEVDLPSPSGQDEQAAPPGCHDGQKVNPGARNATLMFEF